MLEAARRRAQAADHLHARRPPGPRQDVRSPGSSRWRWRRGSTSPPGPRSNAGATSRRSSPGSTSTTCSSSTRSTGCPSRRGGPLLGDGGLPARHRHRQGPDRPIAAPRSPSLHPHRCNHALGAHQRPVVCALRTCGAARLLRRGRAAGRHRAGRRDPRRDDRRAGAGEIARRSRGTPRIANRLLRRVRDWAEVRGTGVVDHEAARRGLDTFDVDALGLDRVDRAILRALTNRGGDPVGLSTLAVMVGGDGRHRRGGLRAVPPADRVRAAHAPRPAWRPPPRTSTCPSPFPRRSAGCPSTMTARTAPASVGSSEDACASRTSTTSCPSRRSPRRPPSRATAPGCSPGWRHARPPPHHRPALAPAARRPRRRQRDAGPAGAAAPAQGQRRRSRGAAARTRRRGDGDVDRDGPSRTAPAARYGTRPGHGGPSGRHRGTDRRHPRGRIPHAQGAPVDDGTVLELLDRHGEMPLPPYIHERLDDPERYQTVFARRPASAAAPTAGCT